MAKVVRIMGRSRCLVIKFGTDLQHTLAQREDAIGQEDRVGGAARLAGVRESGAQVGRRPFGMAGPWCGEVRQDAWIAQAGDQDGRRRLRQPAAFEFLDREPGSPGSNHAPLLFREHGP
jgi:hypothetical protein